MQDDHDQVSNPGGLDGRGEDELELGVQGGEAPLHSGELIFFILLNALEHLLMISNSASCYALEHLLM